MCLFYVCLSCLTTRPHSATPHFELFFVLYTQFWSVFLHEQWFKSNTCKVRSVAGCGEHQNNYHLTVDSVSSVDILASFTKLKMYFTNNHFDLWSNFHYAERCPHFGFDLHNSTGLICSHHAHQLHFQPQQAAVSSEPAQINILYKTCPAGSGDQKDLKGEGI